jgi:ABC-2 type transport system ATP-binding protein
MDEVEKVAKKVSIIDKGKIITTGNIKDILKKTKTKSLEDAFIKITGYNIREEEASNLDRMRLGRKLHSRK